MDTINVTVGSYTAGNGIVQDNTRPVEFEGEKLAKVNSYGYKDSGAPDDARGTRLPTGGLSSTWRTGVAGKGNRIPTTCWR
jgi:hypothetical protein